MNSAVFEMSENSTNIRKNQKKKWKCYDNKVLPIYNKDKQESIGKFYIYHTFLEIMKLKPDHEPFNDYIKIIGQFHISTNKIPYIQGLHEDDKEFAIFINIKLLDILPTNNQVMQAFGHLEFQNINNNFVPLFVAHFIVNLKGDIANYIECLKLQRKLLPKTVFNAQNKSRIEDDSDFIDLLENLSYN